MLLHLLLLAFLSPVRADQGCVALLEHPAPSVLMAPPPSRKALSPDQSFSAYFSDLLQETILGTEELLVYKKNLEEGRIVNPITDHLALMRDGAWVASGLARKAYR